MMLKVENHHIDKQQLGGASTICESASHYTEPNYEFRELSRSNLPRQRV